MRRQLKSDAWNGKQQQQSGLEGWIAVDQAANFSVNASDVFCNLLDHIRMNLLGQFG